MLRRGARAVLVGGIVLAVSSAGASDRWEPYENARYRYEILVPPGFSPVEEAANSDGGVAVSAGGEAELRVWGGQLLETGFADEVANRVDSDKEDGWIITYDRRSPSWASWSGSRGRRVFYQRAVPGCDGTAVFFRIEYPSSRVAQYQKVVDRLVKSLHSAC